MIRGVYQTYLADCVEDLKLLEDVYEGYPLTVIVNCSPSKRYSRVDGIWHELRQSGGGAGVELGEDSSTGYRGDRGKVAYDHSQSTHETPGAASTALQTANTYTDQEINSLAASTATALSNKSNTNHNHNGTYEPANSNIQSHISTAHAPGNAQKNSDITLAEIEAKLTGLITSHSHNPETLFKLRQTADNTNATVTPTALTGLSFAYVANSFYIFDMYMACTSAAATTGYSFTLDVSTAVTTLGLTFVHALASTGTITGGDSIADNTRRGLSSGVTAITVINPIMGRGFLWTGANAGTAQFMFSPEVAASVTCRAGSIITVQKIS